jgi:hypothetical protein
MNEERINELLKQSRTEYWTQYTPSYDYEKFAQLIVRECANISNQAEQQCQHPATQILKHFGVEQ